MTRPKNLDVVAAALVVLAIILAIALLEGCGKQRPSAPPVTAPPPSAVPGPDASAETRATFYERQASELRAQSAAATKRAIDARTEADAAELRTWRTWCRWIGVLGIALGVAAAGLLTWLASPRIGLPLGAIIVATALSVSLYGAALPWLLWALGAALAIAGAVWLISHLRDRAGLRSLWDKTQEEAMADLNLVRTLVRVGVKIPTEAVTQRMER